MAKVYCTSCRIGVVDEMGLCELCGARQTPPTRVERLAETGGALLAVVLHPLSLAGALLVVLLIAVAVYTKNGTHAPAGAPRVGPALPNPGQFMAAAHADPVGTLFHFLLPVLFQGFFFALLLLLLFTLWRWLRLRQGPRSSGLQE